MQNNSPSHSFEIGQEVELEILARTDLGFKALINGQAEGLLYANEVFRPLRPGQIVRGYVKKMRDDGKIDLSLYREGHKAGEEIAPRILELLEEAGGFLPFTENIDPQEIYELFGVSKKKYKIALGGLYKKKLISIEDQGIRLLRKK